MENQKTIKDYISNLAVRNSVARQRTRRTLINLGEPAIPLLMEAMEHPNKNVRWEAAKALIAIHDTRSIPVLVKALTDKNFEIRWLAAKALIALKLNSLPSLLKELINNPENWNLRQGAHHVLNALKNDKLLNDKCLTLLDELRSTDTKFMIPVTAQAALNEIIANRQHKNEHN